MCCPLVFEFSVGIRGFVIGLGQISFFFSVLTNELLYVALISHISQKVDTRRDIVPIQLHGCNYSSLCCASFLLLNLFLKIILSVSLDEMGRPK